MTALSLNFGIGFAPKVDVDCNGVQTLPACGSEKEVPDLPLRASIFAAATSTGTMGPPVYSSYNTITDEERVAVTPLGFIYVKAKVEI